MAYLEVKNASKYFEDCEIFSNLSFELDKGQSLVLAGPSGAGKSTVLRCLNGLDKFDQGKVILDGKEVVDGKKFGLVFQQFELFPQYNALENVTLAPSLKNPQGKEKIDEKAKSILKFFALEDHIHKYPYQLSGGQRQRVAIARALILDPEVLCLDEPTSALDPALRDQVAELILKLKSEGMTQLIVTHDLDFAEKIADKILTMN